jgi:hypothetical protein
MINLLAIKLLTKNLYILYIAIKNFKEIKI